MKNSTMAGVIGVLLGVFEAITGRIGEPVVFVCLAIMICAQLVCSAIEKASEKP